MGHGYDEDSPPFAWPTHSGHHQQFPNIAFKDVRPEVQQPVTETSVDDVVSTIKQIVNTFVEKQTESTIFSSTTTTTEINLGEAFNSNNTMVALNETSFNEMFGSNSTVMDLNNTLVTEMADTANATAATTFGEAQNATSFVSDTVTAMVDTVVTTTESVINTVSEAVTPMVTTTSDVNSEGFNYEHHKDSGEEKTLYIVLGVILGALILIIIILLIIYKRYKSRNHARSGVYCVTDLNEVSTSSSKNLDQHTAKFS